jgi:hypothetical protein
MDTLADAAFYKFEKMTGVQEGWVPGANCWGKRAKIGNEVYFHDFAFVIESGAKLILHSQRRKVWRDRSSHFHTFTHLVLA